MMASSVVGFLWKLCWSNPYTAPPDGQPRVLAEEFVPCEPGRGAGKPPASLRAIPNQPGSGYSISVCAITPPPETLSGEQLVKARRQRLERRMRKYPLFAEQFIQDELNNKAGYYAGRSDYDQARQKLLDEWQERFDTLSNRSSQ